MHSSAGSDEGQQATAETDAANVIQQARARAEALTIEAQARATATKLAAEAEAEATRIRAAAEAQIADTFAQSLAQARLEVERTRAYGESKGNVVFAPLEALKNGGMALSMFSANKA